MAANELLNGNDKPIVGIHNVPSKGGTDIRVGED